jgi:hypothetical protein
MKWQKLFTSVVGRTPRSARVPLDPPLVYVSSFIRAAQADGGVGCGLGSPSHNIPPERPRT